MNTSVIKTWALLITLIVMCLSSVADTLILTGDTYSQDSDDTPNTGIWGQKIYVPEDVVQLTNITWYWKFSNKNDYNQDYLRVGIMNDPPPANADKAHYIDYYSFEWGQSFPPGATLYKTPLYGENSSGTFGVNVTPETFYWIVLIDENGQVNSDDANFPLGADPGLDTWRLQRNSGGAWSAWADEYDKNLSFDLYANVYNCTTSGAENVEETTADLVGYLSSTAGTTVTMGFWVGNATQTATTIERNITMGVATDGNNTHSLTGLNSSHYYYFRPWILSDYGFKISTEEGTFLTKPYAPKNLTTASSNATNVTLTWDNVTAGPLGAQNQTSVLVYSTSDFPISVDAGTVAYNGSAEEYTLEGLSPITTYYFSVFTYINDSGSPFYWWYSDLFGSTSNVTAGSNYSVSIRWECNSSVVNLNDGGSHLFTLEKADGTILNSSYRTDADGEFNVTSVEGAQVATFMYNNTIFRAVLISPTTTNITIFIPCGDIGSDVGDITPVTIFFLDFSGALTPDNEAIGFLYRYLNGTQQYMYMNFLQADLAMRTFLNIGTTYYVGVGCRVFSQPNLGPLTIYEDEYTINVFYNETVNNSYVQLFEIETGWTGTTLYFDFLDPTHAGTSGVQNTSISLMYLFNNTVIETEDQPVPWNFNYTYPNLNTSSGYRVQTTVTYTTSQQNWTTTFTRVYLPFSSLIIINDVDYVDSILNQTLGGPPIQFDGQIVTWTTLIAMVIITFFMFLFSPRYIGMVIFGTGILLGFLKAPMNLLSESVFPWSAVGLILLVGFLAFTLMRRNEP